MTTDYDKGALSYEQRVLIGMGVARSDIEAQRLLDDHPGMSAHDIVLSLPPPPPPTLRELYIKWRARTGGYYEYDPIAKQFNRERMKEL
jgi:hypothetical protein